MSEALLSFRGVDHRFPDGVAGLSKIEMDIFAGELLLLAGPNGAGKTLLMRHAIGLARPFAGRVLYRGEEIGTRLKTVRRNIGIVFQHPEEQIIEDTVAGEIAFGPENRGIRGAELRRRVERELSRFSLEHLSGRHPMTLSGGERRRLALASILAMQPELLLLDEPFMELDFPGVRDLLKILLEIHAEGHGICIITHDVGKILSHADRLVLMNSGKISAAGTPGELLPLLEEHGVRNPCRGGISLSEASWS
jgi:biotin transport system ATP-binding protein